jgi:hypothetical protein
MDIFRTGPSHQNMKTIMKDVLLFLICFVNLQAIQAQDLKNKLPDFKIALTNSTYFDGRNIKKAAPVMFVYFLPDCNECENFTKVLLDNIKALQGIQIIMITNTSLKEVSQFEQHFNLKRYSNIKVGSEGKTFVFQRQFNIETFPFVALFNNRGSLMATYSFQTSPENLVNKIKEDYKLTKR